MYNNVINKAFGPVRHLDAAVGLLDSFWALARREAIRRCVEKRAADVRLLFSRERRAIRREFDGHRRAPPLRVNEPQHAGSALWARSLMGRIRRVRSLVRRSSCPVVRGDDEAESAVEVLLSALHAYQKNRYNDWMEILSSTGADDLKSKLEVPLLRRQNSDTQQQFRPLACNFDTDLLALFSEVVCWERLHVEEFEIPSTVLSVCHNKEPLRVAREHVMAMVRSFNELLDDLAEHKSSLLFADHIRRVEKKIMPGLSKLTWTSRVIERFVQACLGEIHAVHALAKRFHAGMEVIMLQCSKISSLRLLRIDRNAQFKEDTFQSQQEKHREYCTKALSEAHSVMSGQLSDLYALFEDCSDEVKARWLSHVREVDKHLLESLTTCVKKSLTLLCTAIHGEEGTGDTRTLFALVVVLQDGRVETKPSLIDLTHTVNSVAKDMIGVIQTMPCLVHLFDDSSDGADSVDKNHFYNTVSSNESILNLVVKVMEGIAFATADIGRWLLTWNKYKSLWDMDKDSFLRRYARQNNPVATFDRDISRHKEQQAIIESEDSSHTVKFIQVSTHLLKAALVRHSVEWQEKLLGLLQRNAEASLTELAEMLEANVRNLLRTPRDIAQLKAALDLTDNLRRDMSDIEKQIGDMEGTFRTLSKYEAPVSDESTQRLNGLRPSLEVLCQELASADDKLDKIKTLMRNDVRSSLTSWLEDVRALRDSIAVQIASIAPDVSEEIESKIASLRTSVEAKRKQEQHIQPGLDLFGIDQPDDKALRDCERLCRSFDQVWTISKDWGELWSSWNTQPIKCLDAKKMEEAAQSALKNVTKLKRDASTWPIFKSIQTELEQAKNVIIPMVAAMNDEAMRPRHWTLLKKQLGNFVLSPEVVLSDSLGMLDHSPYIVNLASKAVSELAVEEEINATKKRWEEATVSIAGHQIKNAEDTLLALEGDGAALGKLTMMEHFRDDAARLEQDIVDMKSALETFISVSGKMNNASADQQSDFKEILGSDADMKLRSLCFQEKPVLPRLLDMESKLNAEQSS